MTTKHLDTPIEAYMRSWATTEAEGERVVREHRAGKGDVAARIQADLARLLGKSYQSNGIVGDTNTPPRKPGGTRVAPIHRGKGGKIIF